MVLRIQVSKETLIQELEHMDLDWGDEEDAKDLVALLLERYTVTLAWTWLAWHNERLGGMPIVLLQEGRGREVFAEARRVVGRVL
jgi:hypothetical protein